MSLNAKRTYCVPHQTALVARAIFPGGNHVQLARGRGMLKGGGRQRSDSTHVLGAMRTMSRLEVVGETLHHALNALATAAPDWLCAHTNPAWVERYGRRASEFRLPKSEAGRRTWAKQTGVDGATLLALVTADGAPPVLRGLVALETLPQVWIQNFLVEHGPEGPCVDWRTNEQTPPSGRYIGSPYDPEARYATKGTTVWSGYKVHLTETCDNGVPNLITNVGTANAAVSDDAVTSTIHAALEVRDLLPKTHVADTGFVIAQGVRSSRLRETPYFGQAKTHLAHLMTAAAMNLVRLLRWVAGEPKAQTQHLVFAGCIRSPLDAANPQFATNVKVRKSHQTAATSILACRRQDGERKL